MPLDGSPLMGRGCSVGLRGLVRLPREPSAAGIIVFSAAVGVVSMESVTLWGLLFAAAAVSLHVLTFDAAFDAAKRRCARLVAAVASVNVLPYAAAFILGRSAVAAALLAYSPLFAGYTAAAVRGLLGTAMGYIADAALLSYTAVLASVLAGEPTTLTITAAGLMALYTASTAAYVESRLPMRSTSPLLPLALWLPALPLAAAVKPALHC
ncbi:hypothetical protein [Hyperthermus butylicus]|uniref:Uncharacterized protein n=1 Tax=Hyperthermus butylicus (strain DSM 5456 / JCM 9403 / PLM1-5) TaxID=415426 RepID=A2BKG6_HYPBU|nr:hypothetical protein [Hyperthermus butylicus]ABM80478.1 hypothetical protein Hbut_0620 [Hyperthermus butylicus DSM 5456]